ncbi:acetoacetate decarboxylase [Cladophialophora yegresii CBS 114405]|uniref:Acetoacetate decarboxylase n=1 Tax=Cladophialophora yegresii CBS 114405 TaxID=1182544 RepID=W9WEN9_9EURO|nr:acetoacetate decarboxylase [Cladophialophora yegresii CBS 114405]EXJ56994.1 acetoacetate decarboxylase [Cladophialophora yegresii CBS 114405]
MPFGRLKTKQANAVPAFSPAYSKARVEWADIDMILISFYTKAEAIAKYVPEELEIEEEPLVTYFIANWGFSSMGAYTEFVGYVEIKYKGEKYDFALELVLENEAALFLGREQFGMPKVIGHVEFDRRNCSSSDEGALTAYVERPVGHRSIQFAFKADARVHRVKPLPPPEKRILVLRIIPGAGVSDDPVVREFVSLLMQVTEGEVWSGVGSIKLNPGSEFDIAPNIPVIRYNSSVFISHGSGYVDGLARTHKL